MWLQGSHVCGPNLCGCASTSNNVEDLKTVRTQNLLHTSREGIIFIVGDFNFSNFYLFMFNIFRSLNPVLSKIM
jgi:hypothetical protein